MSSVINVRLNERMTVQFVELYRDERLLWDKDHESYNKRAERLRAYRRIADGMAVDGLGVPEVASKIKNIRSTYLQELKKIKDSAQRHQNAAAAAAEEEEAAAPYVPKLLWFPILDSMIGDAAVKRLYAYPPASDMLSVDYVEGERSATTIEFKYEYDEAEDPQHDRDVSPPFSRKRTPPCDDYPGSCKMLYSYEQQQSSTPQLFAKYVTNDVHDRDASPPFPLKRTSSCDGYPESRKKSRSRHRERESATELFAKYIATSVHALPPRLAIQAQKELHDVLIKYKLEECDQEDDNDP